MTETIQEKLSTELDISASLTNCLEPLLEALDWQGSRRHLAEAMPHKHTIYNITLFRRVMESLQYESGTHKTQLSAVDARLFPCLFVDAQGASMVLLSQQDDRLMVFDGHQNQSRWISVDTLSEQQQIGEVFVFKPATKKSRADAQRPGWFRSIFLNNKSLIYTALALSFVLNVLALAAPLFIMAVYDRVIGTSSYPMLSEFLIGIVIAIAVTMVLFQIRTRLLALIGARVDREVGDKIWERLLYLAPSYTESATVGAQVSRIRDFDRFREFLSGPLFSVLFDLPFVLISLIIVLMLGGVLVFVPIAMIIVFMLISAALNKSVQRRASDAGREGSEFQEFLLEAIQGLRVIKYTAGETTWYDRYRELSSKVAFANFRVTVLSAISNAISEAVMIAAGLAVISFGAVMVINGSLTVGGMIAVMILIWRTLAPLKSLFNAFPRLTQIKSSIMQITRLMEIPPEVVPTEIVNLHERHFKGDITFHRVSFRYQASYDPALIGVSFTIPAGSLVGVLGRNGSGKSTILKLLLGLYQPQAGSIRIDGRDIRQMNPIELRTSVAYLPQRAEVFYGTIEDNLRLSDPVASMDDLIAATKKAGILREIEAMEHGFKTPVGVDKGRQLSDSFCQGLCLARVYLKKTSVVLLDEPASTLDREDDELMMQQVEALRSHATVFMVTYRPSHLKKMDQIILMEQGQVALIGTPEEVLAKLSKELI